MSSFDEDSYSMIFTSLKHPIRRRILRTLSNEAQSFSDLQKQFKIESSHLTYHIDGLGSLLNKTEDEKYALSSLGQAAVLTMQNVEEPPSTLYFHLKQGSGLNGKKTANRTIAIALGIVCIVLVATLAGALAYYIPLLNDKDNVVSALTSQISDKDLQIYLLNGTITFLNNAVKDLNDTVNLFKVRDVYNTSWIAQTNPSFNGLDLPATFVDIDHGQVGNYALDAFFSYAGYIVVKINSTSSDTYVNYACVSNLCTFNLQTDIGLNGTATFPVIPLDHWNYHPRRRHIHNYQHTRCCPSKNERNNDILLLRLLSKNLGN
jgi:DNA-binding transcriptional ArsR family regulator